VQTAATQCIGDVLLHIQGVSTALYTEHHSSLLSGGALVLHET